MPTHYFLAPNGTLRHGHGNANAPDPTKGQWHDADTYHRSDPNGHDREQSWTNPIWSQKNWDIASTKKDHLVLEAYIRYEANACSANYWNYKRSQAPHPRAVLHDDAAGTLNKRPTLPVATDPQPKPPAPPTPIPVKPEPAPEPTPDPLAKAQAAVQAAVAAAKAASEPAEAAEFTVTEEQPTTDPDLEKRVSDLEEGMLALGNIDQTVRTIGDDAHKITKNIESRFDSLEAGREAQAEAIRQLKQETQNLPAVAALETRITQLEQSAARKVEFTIKTPEKTYTHTVVNHEKFDELVTLALSLDPYDRNIWIAGPAGSGKTTAARKLAELLELPFEFQGAIDTPYKLSGYKDANGNYHSTQFRRMYEHGGVWLGDEIDGSSPSGLLEANAALANGTASFPDGMIPRHKNFIALAAANTWGLGGDANYVGRAKLDAAFLDRFVTLEWNYDEALEREAAGGPGEWVDVVQAVRAAALQNGGVGLIISPRASIKGCQLLRAGCSNDLVVRSIFGRYRNHSLWSSVGKAAEDFAKRPSRRPVAAAPATPQTAPTQGVQSNGLGAVDFSKVR